MTDIAEFLLSRIAEDEAISKSAPGPTWHSAVERSGRPGRWAGIAANMATLDAPEPTDSLSVGETVVRSDGNRPFAIDHVARWDPARVLAECEAKRHIVERAVQYEEHISDDFSGQELADDILALLAHPYSDHPEFRQEWRS